MKHFLSLSLACGFAFAASAHTDLLNQNFDGDYKVDFPIVLELDKLPPLPNINPIFVNENGVAQPWWPVKDSSSSTDRFLCSHSAYQYPGKSSDWICSRPLTIPSEGFVLSFGAQSYLVNGEDRLSDLWVFISEQPLDADNLPTEPTMHIEQIGVGSSNEVIEKDFIPYSLNLDEWAGKTVYLIFANLNEGKDILAIDDVLVRRLDIADVAVEGPGEYALNGAYDVKATITGTEKPGLKAWSLVFDDGNGHTETRNGESLAPGESLSFDFSGNLPAGGKSVYSVTLTSDEILPITASGEVKGLSFLPDHKVLFEEATGVWCGNCPLGSFTIESMMLDPEMCDRVIPVSVHIPGSGTDFMVNEEYVAHLGFTAAPLTRTERSLTVGGFGNLDRVYDTSNPNTAAGALRLAADCLTLADISIEANYSDALVTPAVVNCNVTVRPAFNLEGDYGIGIVMTENNVTFNHPYWYQHNYAAGSEVDGDMGGWAKLPEIVPGVRYQDVARGIWGFNGIPESLPSVLPIDTDIEFSYQVEVPDTYQEIVINDNKVQVAPRVNLDNVVMVAYLIDRQTGLVLNAASCPMSPKAEERFTIADLLDEIAGVECIETLPADSDVVEYYNLQGMRLASPVKGMPVIERRGDKTTKKIFN